MNRFLLIFISCLSITINGTEAPVTLTATVSPSTVTIGRSFLYTIQLSGPKVPTTPDLKTPQFSPRFTVRNTKKSQSFSFDKQSNARRLINFEFILVPQKSGTLTIKPSTLIVNGKQYQSNSIDIIVTGTGTSLKKNASRKNTSSGKTVFAVASVDKKSVFVGEQVTYTLELYRRIRLFSEIQQMSPPFTGFLSDSLSMDTKPYIKHVSGKKFHGQYLSRVALFPLDAGAKIIEPAKVGIVLNAFDGQKILKSKRLKLHIKPLPKAGRPDQFSGAVGNFFLRGRLERNRSIVGEPVTYTIELNGEGNLKAINKLQFEPSTSLKIYAANIKDEINYDHHVKGRRLFEYVVIPKTPGEQIVPTFSLSYFSPKEKTYHQLILSAKLLQVIDGNNEGLLLTASQKIKIIDTDIGYLKPVESLTHKDLYPWKTIPGQVLILINCFGIIWILVLRLKRLIYRPNKTALKSKKAYVTALKTITTLEKKSDIDSKEITPLYNVVLSYLSDKVGHSFHGFTQDKVRNDLIAYSFKIDQVDAMVLLIDKISEMAYAPGQLTEESYGQLIKHIKDVLGQMEDKS